MASARESVLARVLGLERALVALAPIRRSRKVPLQWQQTDRVSCSPWGSVLVLVVAGAQAADSMEAAYRRQSTTLRQFD